jgi:hypothetical protein
VAAWALLLLFSSAVRAQTSAGAGASVTAGSEGYRALSVFADADWQAKSVDPYVWGNATASRDSRRLTAVGGAAKELAPGVRANAGAGFTVGRLADTGSGGALVLEAGAEKKLKQTTAGADWRLSAGRLAAPTSAPGEDRRRRRFADANAAGHGKRPQDDSPPSDTYNELGAFARFPVSKAKLTLRLALGFPSYGDSVVSETVSLRFPVAEPLSVTTGVTLEQSDRTRGYLTAGVYYLFD